MNWLESANGWNYDCVSNIFIMCIYTSKILKTVLHVNCAVNWPFTLNFSMMYRSAYSEKSAYTILTWNDTIKASHSAQSALFLSHQHVKKEDASSSVGGGGDDDDGGLVWDADRWAIDLPQHITPAPFTEPITSPADWCADNWAVARVFMFLLWLAPDFSYCIVFYFNTIYNKGHPDVYLCQYSARRLSGRQRDANSCTRHDRPLACPS